MFYITTEEPSICKFSNANQTVDANTGSLGAVTALCECERKALLTIQTRTTNIYSRGVPPVDVCTLPFTLG